MLQHYIKTAFRHLLKYKTQNLISILGLSVGILCFSICLYCSRFIYSVDQCFTNKERIANVNLYTPDGDIYPCHQFVGKDEFKQGSVLDQSFNMDIAQKFAGMNIYSRPKCQKCWAKFYCPGGCSAANYNMNHDMNDSYDLGCEMERKRLECAIYLKAMDKICANQSK